MLVDCSISLRKCKRNQTAICFGYSIGISFTHFHFHFDHIKMYPMHINLSWPLSIYGELVKCCNIIPDDRKTLAICIHTQQKYTNFVQYCPTDSFITQSNALHMRTTLAAIVCVNLVALALTLAHNECDEKKPFCAYSTVLQSGVCLSSRPIKQSAAVFLSSLPYYICVAVERATKQPAHNIRHD